MTSRPVFQVDAFSDELFKGNPAAVVPLDHWLPDHVLQSIAAENNLSETAFYVPTGLDFELRWFTPTTEVDLCGHATLATAHVLFHEYRLQRDVLRFHTHSGVLSVRKNQDCYQMSFPVDTIRKISTPPLLSKALQVDIAETWQGRSDMMAILSSASALRRLTPNMDLLTELGGRGILVTAPGTEGADFVSRCFFPAVGVPEDPVTGSAHTTLTPYWANQLGKKHLVARQLSARGGEIRCQLEDHQVILAGEAVTFLNGTIRIP